MTIAVKVKSEKTPPEGKEGAEMIKITSQMNVTLEIKIPPETDIEIDVGMNGELKLTVEEEKK